MKKILILVLFVLSIAQIFATPHESETDYQNISGSRLKDNTYIGSQKYKSFVGGLYKKNDIVGSVFYIDEMRRTMLILCVTPYKLIKRNESSTYDLIKQRYKSNGWKLLNKDVCKYLIANTPIMIYNRTWKNDDNLCFPLSVYIIMDTEDDHLFINVYTSNYARPFDTTWKWMWVTDENGKETKEYFSFTHTGWREVPLEPEYITHYLGE